MAVRAPASALCLAALLPALAGCTLIMDFGEDGFDVDARSPAPCLALNDAYYNVVTEPNPPYAAVGRYVYETYWLNGCGDLRAIRFEVTDLHPGYYVLNADGAPGQVGAYVSVPDTELGGDGVLSPGEVLIVDFEVGADAWDLACEVDLCFSAIVWAAPAGA